jgi:phosphotransacetylase
MATLDCFDRLVERAKACPTLPVAVVGAHDDSVLAGIVEAAQADLVDPVLVGDPDGIRAAAEEAGVDVGGMPVHAARTEAEQAALGVALVKDGTVGGLVKGHIHTNVFMGPIVRDLRGDRRVSHVFVLELPAYPKLLSVTDAAVNIAPDLDAKRSITQNAIDLVQRFGIERPKVAALSAVELVNSSIASSLDAACLAKMADRGQIKGGIVDGPLAFDVAISAESAETKHLVSPVAGDVDILVVPDIDAGNILVKDLAYLAEATLAGVVLGAAVPVVLTSRADPPEARFLSCALAVLASPGALADDG